MDAAHTARSSQKGRKGTEDQVTLDRLQKYFLADFFDEDGERYLQSDARAVRFVPAILAVTVKLAEKDASPARRFTPAEEQRIKARKAAELSAMIPPYLLGQDAVYEHCETRKALWEAMIDGLLTCGKDGEAFDMHTASALLFPIRLSPNECDVLLRIMHERFARSPIASNLSRFLLSMVADPKASHPKLIEALVKACIEYAKGIDMPEMITTLKKKPVM